MSSNRNLEDIRLRARSQYLYAILGALLSIIAGISLSLALGEAAGIHNLLLIGVISILGMTACVFVALRKKREAGTLARVRKDQREITKLAEKFTTSASSDEVTEADVGTSQIAPR